MFNCAIDKIAGKNRDKSILVVARAQAVDDGKNILLQNLDGYYLDGIAKGYKRMTIVVPIHRKGRDESYSYFCKNSYILTSENIQIIEINDYKNRNYNLFNAFSRLPQQFITISQQLSSHDVVFVMMPTYRAVFAALAGKLWGKPVILYSGNDWQKDIQLSYKWQSWLGKLMFRPYLLISSWAEKAAMKAAKIRLLNGFNLMERYQKYPGITLETKPLIDLGIEDVYYREDSCNGKEIKLICIASVQKRKGFEHLLDAMAQLVKKKNNLSLDIVGNLNHPHASEIKDWWQKLKLENKVRFRGYITHGSELLEIYRQGDIFVLPTLCEGFPRVLFEAMAQSLPIITTNIPNIKERLGDKGLVYYVPPENSEAIAQAIETIITNSQLRQSLIRQGSEYMENLLQGEKASEQFLRVANTLWE